MKKLKKEDREIALDPTQFRKVGSDRLIDLRELDESDPSVYGSIYYKEVPIESKKLSETMIVTYSPKYRAYQANIRQKQLERAQKLLNTNKNIRKERKNQNDPARFIKKTSVTEYGEVADQVIYELDQEKTGQEAMYDGFSAVTTDIDGSRCV